MKKYAKTHELAVAEIEAQVVMAQTIPEALKKGDVKIKNKGPYMLPSKLEGGGEPSSIACAEVDRWRRLAQIPAKRRREFYADNSLPTRAALLRWWEQTTRGFQSASTPFPYARRI